jgi:tripartite ATP-independent transporter DctP family solute receptor
MRRALVAALAVVAGQIWLAPGVEAQSAKPIVMRIAHALPESHSYSLWLSDFKKELEGLAPGRVDVQVFPNAQLGKETEYLEGMKLGTIDGAVMGRHGQIDPRLDVLNLPMIYRGDEHLDAVLHKDGPVLEKINGIMYEKGIKVLGWGELGFRNITTKNAPIAKAADLKGVVIRVPNVEPWLAAFRAWGANPTPMDFSELYSALQQGVVTAQENPPELVYTSKFYEVQKYLNISEHANIPSEFVVSRAYWEKLPNDIKPLVLKAARASQDRQVAATRAANVKLVSDLEKAGMTIVRNVDKESFRAGAEVSWREFEKKFGGDLLKAIQEAR